MDDACKPPDVVEEKATKTRSRNKNILRFKTKPEVLVKTEGKRKRKEKRFAKQAPKILLTDGNLPLAVGFDRFWIDQCKEEISTCKIVLKPNIKAEENKDDAKDKSLTCNCKKSR